MNISEKFKTFYEEQLYTILESLEKERKKILKNYIFTFILLLLAITTFFIIPSQIKSASPITIIILIVGFAILFYLSQSSYKIYRYNFKQKIIDRIVKFINPNLIYQSQNGITLYEFISTELFKRRIDRYHSEDLVSGTIDKTSIKFSEVHAEYKTEYYDSRGRKHTSWHTIFKGILFIGEFNKNFKGKTFVLPDKTEFLGFIGNKLQEMFPHSGELVKLEDPIFEKLFKVYSDDQIEARYILSTSFMKRITDFKNKIGSEILISFISSKINIAINLSRNILEPPIFRSVFNYKIIEEYLVDLIFLIDIVNDLNLNTRIWT